MFPKRAIQKLNGGWEYQINFPSMDWGEEEIAIEIRCDAGQILTKAGNRDQIGICGFMRKRKLNFLEENEFRRGVAISWVTTSKESG